MWDGLSQRIVFLLLRYARVWMTVLLVLTDMTSLLLAGTIAVATRALLGLFANDLLAFPSSFQPGDYLRLSPLILIFLGVYAWRGLIPAIGVSPVEELRRLSISTSIVALGLASVAFLTKSATDYSRIVFGLTWIFALVLVPLVRGIVRWVASHAGVWGEPVAVIGYATKGRWIADYLLTHPTLGLRPIVALNGSDAGGKKTPSIPLVQVGTYPRLREVSRLARVNTAILVVPEVSEELLDDLVEPRKRGYERLIIISDMRQMGSLWVRPLDLGGVLALEVKQNLLSQWQQTLKRALDLVLIGMASVVILPLCLLISLLIWLESRGSMFYGSIRLGKGGQKFKMWKFRTMVPDADQVLQRYLDKNPELRAEWDVNFKLKDDPRVTSVGKFLRKFSLDELPQIWNILTGEMSLVGPRPMLVDEAARYETTFRMYAGVRPGITGLWQTSGRNDSDYDLRVVLADYYVRNWSLWLDIYVLASTPRVVLRRRGAY
ncbi:MAG: undecaprenyl-phosphate galactose phosphotransferase WbaP [Chloroflexi bacterium]|nr:undecaprenyl-phosphate galactose phosphotransferase WbaP [Chloroflexota bacterium]